MTRRGIQFSLLFAAVLGSGTLLSLRLHSRHGMVAHHTPSTPDLRSWPAALTDEITDAERTARSWTQAPEGLAALSRLYHANGFFAEALQCYEGLQGLEPRNPRWPHLAAGILAIYGRGDEALPLFRRAIELAPDYLPSRVRLGDVLVKVNQPADATKVYNEVLQREPANPYALLGLARCAIAGGDWSQARGRLNEAVAAHPDFVGALSLLVTVAEHFGEHDTAESLKATIGRREFTDVPDPWLDELSAVCFDAYRLSVTAAIANSAGDPSRALELLDAAIALAPRVSSYRRQAGQIQLNGQNYASAKTHLEAAVAANPADSDAWLLLVSAFRGLNAEPAALNALRRGLASCPQSPSLHLEYARWLKAAGRPDEAATEFRRGYELRPSDASPLVEIASLLFASGRNQEALASLHLAVERQPAHPMALASLMFYAVSEKDEAEALRRWAQVRQAKTPPEVIESLRQAYQQQFGRTLP
jgi:tetratricopeptide (TPR) repeat protein